MTMYLPSYDIESIRCLKGVREIALHHKAFNLPATFFIVGELLENEAWAEELVSYIDDPLFEIGNHTYSHLLLKMGNQADDVFNSEFRKELEKTNYLISKYFKVDAIGFRSPMGFPNGLVGEKSLLEVLWKCGIRYICTKCLGKHYTVPAPFSDEFYYEEEDILHPILEIPAHGWHDNVLKGYNYCSIMWPPVHGLEYPLTKPSTPDEEFSVWSQWMNYALGNDISYFAPVFHPWSVFRFNKKAETIKLILSFLKKNGIQVKTYGDYYRNIIETRPV